MLFWGFANQITTVDEAKTFYPFFGLGANVALIFSGRAVKYFSQIRAGLPAGVDGWGVSLRGMMSLVVGFGVVITAIYWWLNRSVVPGIEAAASAGAAAGTRRGRSRSGTAAAGTSRSGAPSTSGGCPLRAAAVIRAGRVPSSETAGAFFLSFFF